MSFEAIECATAEAAELIIASTGTELQALITDHNLAGAMSVARASSVCGRRYPHMNIVVVSGTTVKPMPVNTMFFPTEPRSSPPSTKNLDKSVRICLKLND